MDNEFIYDVAFSFLAQDESLALQLHNLVKDRVSSFIYSEQQKKLAGTDGEITFNKVFNKESRIVVILYREGWGETPWTRIEQEAIRNRAHDTGYDFTIWIPLDTIPKLPAYVPKTKLYTGLQRWGVQGAASTIEARITESGGNVKATTNADRARTAAEALQRKATRDSIRSGGDGVEQSLSEFKHLIEAIELDVKDMNKAVPGWHIITRHRDNGIDVISSGYHLVVQASYNRFEPHVLFIHSYNGVWPPKGGMPLFKNPEQVSGKTYLLDIDEYDRLGWSDRDRGTGFITTQTLAEVTVAKFIAMVKESRLKSGR